MFGYELIVIGAMLVLNAVFAAYEMGLASISRARLAVLLTEHKRGAVDAIFMKDRIEASLAIIQLGITIVGVVAAAAGGVGVKDSFSPAVQQQLGISEGLADVLVITLLVIPLTFVTIVFAELVPKMVALQNNEWVVLRLSPSMRLLSRIAHPIVRVIEAAVKAVVRLLPKPAKAETTRSQWLHELRAALAMARTSQLLGERQEKIVLAAASLSTRPARDIIIPIQDMSMIYVGDSLMDALIQAHRDMHTRFPVCKIKGDPQSVDGFVNFKDIIAAMRVNPKDPSIKGISRPIAKVPEDMLLSQLLEMMIQQKTHIVMVQSKSGAVTGMITLEDVLEELVGEIEDEFDRLPSHVHPYSSNEWIVGGGVPMTAVAATVGFDWSNRFAGARVPTLAEWSMQRAPGSFAGGDTFESEGLRVTARKFRRKKLMEAVVGTSGSVAADRPADAP
jgi:putative hemolysin